MLSTFACSRSFRNANSIQFISNAWDSIFVFWPNKIRNRKKKYEKSGYEGGHIPNLIFVFFDKKLANTKKKLVSSEIKMNSQHAIYELGYCALFLMMKASPSLVNNHFSTRCNEKKRTNIAWNVWNYFRVAFAVF